MGRLTPFDWPQQAVAFDGNGRALVLLALPGTARPAARQHARQALRQILGNLLERPAENIVLHEGEKGPRLDGANGNIRISLSYAADRCLIALAKGHALGVDIVRIESIPEIETLSRLYLPPEDCRAVCATPPGARDAAFALAWAQMEARSKCLGLPLTEISEQREQRLTSSQLIDCTQRGAYRIAVAAGVADANCFPIATERTPMSFAND